MASDMSLPLQGRIAVVTGASAGIGEATARALAAAGAGVVLNARRAERLAAIASEIGPAAASCPGDAADASVISAMLDLARTRFGAGRREADLVFINAGRGLRGSVRDSDEAQWEEMIRVNYTGAARLMRAAAERMAGPVPVVQGAPKDAPPPRPPEDWLSRPRDIIVMGSSVGRHVSPFSSMYGSSKSAVHMLAESLRRTLAPRGIRVSLLEPGVVKSEFQAGAGYDPVSFGQFMDSIAPVLEPADIARAVVFLASQPAGVHLCDLMIRPTRQEYP